MRIAVLADTHSPRRWKTCPPAVAAHLEKADAKGRAARMRRLSPAAALVVFGHSQIPWNEAHGGQLLLNPGSPTDRRRQPHGTIGELIIADGRLASARVTRVS